MKSYYLYVDSSPNKEYKNNNFFDFTVILPQNIDISEGEWEIGLCEVHFFKKNERCPDMYICSDIITASFINNITIPVLRFIPEIRGKYYKIYDNIYYHDIVERYLDKIRLYITPIEETNVSFADETLHCTLHLRQKLQS